MTHEETIKVIELLFKDRPNSAIESITMDGVIYMLRPLTYAEKYNQLHDKYHSACVNRYGIDNEGIMHEGNFERQITIE